ncbi:tetratricopeptide repeat-containing sensor histidine kinase [Polaribacter sp. Q13]|uniref:tetratricopeptide repeat-containing sensor histidine kinase n=1 Tax=Polaribacter sp. Q13 TaxID=2806551 RepID=UPI00193BC76D|nr:tetratricopeptide repeat-containing sensor histidine kinase [Polaribacter sp. Q13]QVY64548.1 tetratricopeptide repeat protein [Polaribacter sp. Q13]
MKFEENIFCSKNKYLLLLFLVSFSIFSQEKSIDSLDYLLKEYQKTKQLHIPKQAYLLSENTKNDSLIRITYINFGMKSFFNGDTTNLSVTEKKLHQFYNRTKDASALAKSYYYKGLYFKVKFKFDSTFYYYSKSKDISVQLKDSLEATRRLLSMAALQYDERDYLGSEISIIEGLRFVEPRIKGSGLENYPNEVFFTGLLYERLGNVLFMTDRQEEARKTYLKFFEIQKKSPELDIKYQEARLFNHLATTYESEGNYTEAINYFKKSLAIDSLQFKNVYRYETALGGIAFNNFLLGNKKDALEGYLEVLILRQERNYKRGLVLTHSNLGKIYEANKETKKAIFHSNKGLELAKQINFNRYTLDNLLLLSHLVKGEKGRLLLEEHITLNDSLYRRERSLKNQFAKIRYETEKKDKENVGLKQENSRKNLELERQKQQKIIGWLIATASLLFIGFAAIVVSNRRKKIMFEAKMQKIEAREKERQKIAKSLHDEVAGDIRMLLLKLENANQQEEARSLNIIKENVRNLSHQLSSESFDKVSFKNQIINLVSDFFEIDFKIKVKEIDSVNWLEINNSIKRTLFLSIREGIQNAKKHAAAKIVVLEFSETNNSIFLSISDNGKGFNLTDKKNGIGLKNMKERVNEINGIFNIKSEVEKGTNISVEIPKNGK